MAEAGDELYLIGDLIKRLIHNFNRVESKKRLYKDIKELTIVEINSILYIGCGDMKSMSEIADDLDVSCGTLTITIDKLIHKGYTERIRDRGDRRQVFIKLSEDGVKIYNSIIELKKRVIERIFATFTTEERKSLITAFSKLNSTLEEICTMIE